MDISFYLSGTQASSPCTVARERWGFNITTPLGKAFYAAFLTAYSQGKRIRVEGTKTCIHGNTEAVNELQVID